MKLTIDTSSYNERRYGKPYIAKMNFTTSKGEPEWGEWVGQPGSAGMLICDCEPGDIVMRGQRDNRNMKYSAPDYYIVRDDMSLAECTKVEAYKEWQAAHS